MNETVNFLTLLDENGEEYFSVNTTAIKETRWPGRLDGRGNNMCSFLRETMPIKRRATGMFSTDLTERDDVILAVLSLSLLLVIESILSTILLRTSDGNVTNSGFSVKHYVDLARDFKFKYMVKGREGTRENGRVDKKLLFFATAILLFLFAVEVLVLFLTTPELVTVDNSVASFEVLPSVFPNWIDVRNAQGFLVDRPCASVFLDEVKQGQAAISACLTSQIPAGDLDDLKLEYVEVEISTDEHKYGANHNISIGDLKGMYASRAFFRRPKVASRILPKRRLKTRHEDEKKVIHRQFIAMVFNLYNNRTKDKKATLDMLNSIDFEKGFKSEPGPNVDILQVNKRSTPVRVTSTRFRTKFEAVVPKGVAALQLAKLVLKASVGIGVSGPDVYDLKMGSGQVARAESTMWEEESRSLNWLSLLLILIIAGAILLLLRAELRPSGTAEIAGLLVGAGSESRASFERSPFDIARDADRYFRMSMSTLETTSDLGYDDGKDSFGSLRESRSSDSTAHEAE